MTDERARMNADAGRLYYQALTDAQGYPNGMPYWPEMSVADQYHVTQEGLCFLELLARAGLVKSEALAHLGTGNSVYGKGDCAALVAELERRHPEGLREFRERLNSIRSVNGLPPEESAEPSE